MIHEHMISKLRAAKAEVEKQKRLIHEEMMEQAKQCRYWTNGQCKAWPAYEAALRALDDLREGYGV